MKKERHKLARGRGGGGLENVFKNFMDDDDYVKNTRAFTIIYYFYNCY